MKRASDSSCSDDSSDGLSNTIHVQSGQENPALVQASKDGNWTEISKHFSEGVGVNDSLLAEESRKITVLELVSRYGHIECVKKLIEIGATKDLTKAMIQAAEKGHVECFRALMHARFCHEVNDNERICKLVNLIKKEDFESIQKMLVESDLKNVICEIGDQLMKLLVVHNSPTSCLQALMDLGVDINQKSDMYNLTPLKCSIFANNLDSVRFFLRNGVEVLDIDEVIYCKDDECLGELVKCVAKEQVICYLPWIMNVHKTSCMSILLKYLENVDSKDKCGMTLLMWACRKNSLPWVKFLLGNHANANFRSNRGDTGLSIACTNGHYQIVELLLKHKVNINAQFLEASPSAQKEAPVENMVRKLYDHNADMGFCGLGEHALSIACSKGHDDIVDLLLKNGANVFMLKPSRFTVIMEAALRNRVYCLRKFLQFSFPLVNQKEDDGRTALMMACFSGHEEVVDILLENKADVDSQDLKGKSALMYAALNKNSVKCVQLLLEYKANIHLKNRKGRTALMVACSSDNVEAVDILLTHGSDVNIENVKGRTAMMYAAVNNSVACLQKLLDHHADSDLINKEGYTSLMIACIRGYDEIVDLLIKNKAKLNMKNGEGKTAIMYASVCRNTSSALKIIPKLVESGADVNGRTYTGDTALFYAAAVGNTEVAEVLVKNGADINIRNKAGRTAIMYAQARDHTECTAKLLDLGADLTDSDNEACE